MRVLYGLARVAVSLFCLHLWLVGAEYLSMCVPDVSFEHEVTRLWWGRGAESVVLNESECVAPEDGYGEKGYDISFTFRLSDGAVLEMLYYCSQVTVTEADLRAAEAAGGAPADGAHTFSIGCGREKSCLLDGNALPDRCLRHKAGKWVQVSNKGTGKIALSDLRVVFPPWRDPRPLKTREAPRTAEELFYRGKIRARYLIYAEAPPPLPVSAGPQSAR